MLDIAGEFGSYFSTDAEEATAPETFRPKDRNRIRLWREAR